MADLFLLRQENKMLNHARLFLLIIAAAVITFLATTVVRAELLPQNFPSDATIQRSGSIVTVKMPGYCWWVDASQFSLIPEVETPVAVVVLQNLDQAKPCGWSPQWITAQNYSCKPQPEKPCTRPIYDGNWKAIGRVGIGVACEDDTQKKSTGGREWHYTTNANGQRGLAVCEVSH